MSDENWEFLANIRGPSGKSPYIGDNGNWFEYDDEAQGFFDTGKPSQGEPSDIASVISIIDGYWAIDGIKTTVKAQGEPGISPSVSISNDGYWIINGVKTTHYSVGPRGIQGVGIYDITVYEEFTNGRTYRIQYTDETYDYFTVYDGIDGVDGHSMLVGGEIPSSSLGNNDDIYINTNNYDLYYKYSNEWNLIGNIKGTSDVTSIAISDLNNAIETGFYNCYSADNAPTSGFYTIEANTDGANVIQTATNANGEMYTRIGYNVQNNPSWGAWKTSALNQIIDLIYPVGSPFFSFLVTEDPNIRFPGTTWVRIEENTYLVSAGESLVGMTPVGSNTKTLTSSNLPNHNHTLNNATHVHSNNHGHSLTNNEDTTRMLVYKSSGISGTRRSTPAQSEGGNAVFTGETTINNYTGNTGNPTTTLSINNSGSGESFDNKPKSLAIYMWRRTA